MSILMNQQPAGQQESRLPTQPVRSGMSDALVKPTEYRNDKKIAGLRSHDKTAFRVAALIAHFGKMRIRSITPGAILRFKEDRLNTKTKNGKERSIATVNRELEILRAILRYAKSEGLIDRSPFENVSTPLISKADETKSDRILSRGEKERLLIVCGDPVRAHLRPLIIAAPDTGCRKGVLLSLTWKDVNFESGVIRVRTMTTKTLTERFVPISERLAREL